MFGNREKGSSGLQVGEGVGEAAGSAWRRGCRGSVLSSQAEDSGAAGDDAFIACGDDESPRLGGIEEEGEDGFGFEGIEAIEDFVDQQQGRACGDGSGEGDEDALGIGERTSAGLKAELEPFRQA